KPPRIRNNVFIKPMMDLILFKSTCEIERSSYNWFREPATFRVAVPELLGPARRHAPLLRALRSPARGPLRHPRAAAPRSGGSPLRRGLRPGVGQPQGDGEPRGQELPDHSQPA